MDGEPQRSTPRKKKKMEDLSRRNNKKLTRSYRQNRDIPHDIMLNIFTRLPPKSLFRFKCVCKGWRALFQDKTFMDFYGLHRQQKVVNLLGRLGEFYLFFSLDKTQMIPTKIPLSFKVSEEYTFTSACNGLFCMPIRNLGLMVWNPITNESKVVHDEDPRAKKCNIGFGFDVVSNKFKVIRSYTSTQIQVLTVGNEEWRNVEGGSLNGLTPPIDRVIYLNGSLYWFTRTEQRGIRWMTSFNLGDETFGMLPVPCHGPLFRWHWLCEFEGFLCIIGFDAPKVFNLWLWIGDEEKWFNQRISLPFEAFRIPLEAILSVNSVTYITSGEILVECFGEGCFYLCCYEYDKQQRQKEIQLAKVTKLVGIDRMLVIGKHDDNFESSQRFL